MTSHERPTERSASPDLAASVVVPAYDAERVIGGCLAALDAQTLPPGAFEVLIVDDGSRDATADVVERFASSARGKVRLLRRAENLGPAAARNAAIEAARADVIAFTDADCEPDPDWLERALARLAAFPDAAAVEGRIEPKGEAGPLTHQMRNVTGGQYMTANMTYRRSAIEKAGGFDERFRAAYLEDTDLAFSVIDSGGEIVWDPAVVVRHLVVPEGRRKFARDARKHFYNPLVYRKHPALYLERLRPFRPAFPLLYVRHMAAVLELVGAAAVALVANAWLGAGLAIAGVLPFARGWWRVAYVHRARDPLSFLQAGVYPFVHTFWVLAGCVRFRVFSVRL